MSNTIRIMAQQDAYNGNELWTQVRDYSKLTRDNTYVWTWLHTDQIPEITDRLPSYLDQWVDEDNNNDWVGVWSSADTLNAIQYIDPIPAPFNLYKADSFVVGLHQPVVISDNYVNSSGRIKARAKGGATDSYQYTLKTGGSISCDLNNSEHLEAPVADFFGTFLKKIYVRAVFKRSAENGIILAQGDATNYIRIYKHTDGFQIVLKNTSGVQSYIWSTAHTDGEFEEIEIYGIQPEDYTILDEALVKLIYNGQDLGETTFTGYLDDITGPMWFNSTDGLGAGNTIEFFYVQVLGLIWNFNEGSGLATFNNEGSYANLISNADPLLMWVSGGDTLISTTGEFIDLDQCFALIYVIDTGVDVNEPGSQPLNGYPAFIGQKKLYLPKYTGTFHNDNGDTVFVDILLADYTGDVEEICLTGDPLHVTTDITGDDFLYGVMPTDIQLNVLKERDDQFNEFLLTDGDAWRIRIRDGLDLDITGRLILDNLNFIHLDNPSPIALDAVAGMTDLSEQEIAGWSGPITLIDVINYIQQRYNKIQYAIKEFVGIRAEADPDNFQYQTLGKYKVNAAMFNGKNPKAVLNMILKSFGCTLTHSNDNYILIHALDGMTRIGDTLIGSAYFSSGEFQLNIGETITPLKIKSFREIADPKEPYYLDRQQGYGILTRVKEITVKDQFTECDQWNMITDVDKYVRISGNANGSISEGREPGSISLNGVETGKTTNFYNSEKASAGAHRVYQPGLRISSTLEYKVSVIPEANIELFNEYYVRFLFMYGRNKCFAGNNDGNLDNNMGYLHVRAPQLAKEWNTVDVETITTFLEDQFPVPSNGTPIRLWLYGIWSYDPDGDPPNPVVKYMEVKNASIKVLLPEDHESNLDTVTLINPHDGLVLEDYILDMSEAPVQYGYGVNTGGVLVGENLGNILEGWISFASGSGTLKQVTANRINLLRGKHVKRLSGTIHHVYPKSGEVIYDPTLDGGLFMLQHYSYDVKMNKISFTALEIIADTGNIDLETGFDILTEDDTQVNLQ